MRNTVKREILSFSSGKTVSFKKRLGNATFPYLVVSLKSAFSTHTSSWPFKLFLDVDLCCLTIFSCMSTYDLLRPPFLFNVQWAAMGKPGHFCCLMVLFKKKISFYSGGNDLVHCYCLLPCEHYPALAPVLPATASCCIVPSAPSATVSVPAGTT